MSTTPTLHQTSYTIPRGVKPMSIGKRVALAAGAVGVGAALGLALSEHTGSVLPGPAAAVVVHGSSTSLDARAVGIASTPDSGPDSKAIAVSWCRPPTKVGQPGQPIQPFSLSKFSLSKCVPGTDGGTGSVSGGDGGSNDYPGNSGGGGGTDIGGGGGGLCVGYEIECHQPF
jgi:hypothetical protein